MVRITAIIATAIVSSAIARTPWAHLRLFTAKDCNNKRTSSSLRIYVKYGDRGNALRTPAEAGAGSLAFLGTAGPTGQVQSRPQRHNPGGVYRPVSDVIMTFDVVMIHCLGDSGLLIQIQQIALQIRVIDNPANVAFEVAVIDGIEPNERAK